MRITKFFQPLRHCQHSKIGRLAIGNLIPLERRRYTRIRKRTHRVRRTRRAIFRVLVVVEEHTVTFLFPPLRTRELRYASLDLTRQRHRCASHFTESPTLLNSHVNVHPTRATRLGPTSQSHFFEQRLHFECNQPNTFPFHSRTRI